MAEKQESTGVAVIGAGPGGCAAAIQYVQHQAVMSGAEFESIRKELLVHSQEEMNHAVMLSEQIDFLGGVPSVDVEKRAVSKTMSKCSSRTWRVRKMR